MAFLGNVSSCSELFSPIFFPFSTIVYNERTLKQMVKNQKEELFLKQTYNLSFLYFLSFFDLLRKIKSGNFVK